MAFDRRKMQSLLHKQKHDIEGPPLPEELRKAHLRRQLDKVGGFGMVLACTLALTGSVRKPYE